MSIIRENLSITTSDSPAIDAFGRWRVSNPETLFDSKQIFDDSDIASNAENSPLFYDNVQFSGSGTSTLYEVNKAQTTLGVSNTTAGVRIRQTKLRFNYQPGKSLSITMSFLFGTKSAGITRREGYFDANNGVFLEDNGVNYGIVTRSNVTGSPVDTRVAQSSFNLDKMDGTGKSKITLDFTKTQLFFIDMEWLGVGRVRTGFVVNGLLYYAHEFLNTNVLTTVYMSTPNLPLRSEIRNDGTGPAATLVQICSTVASEGGQNKLGVSRAVSTGGTPLVANVTGTVYALLGLRKKSNYIGCTIKIEEINLQIQTANDKLEWMILLNPTIAGAFTYVDVPLSACQYAKGAVANTVTNGYMIHSGFLESGGASTGAAASISSIVSDVLRLGSTIAGVRDEIVLCVRPVAGSGAVDVEGSICYFEAT